MARRTFGLACLAVVALLAGLGRGPQPPASARFAVAEPHNAAAPPGHEARQVPAVRLAHLPRPTPPRPSPARPPQPIADAAADAPPDRGQIDGTIADPRTFMGLERVDERVRADDTRPPLTRTIVCDLTSHDGGAAAALQACVREAPVNASVEIPPGTYVFDRRVVIGSPLAVRTLGTGGTSVSCVSTPAECAVLVAAPQFSDAWGLLAVTSTVNVVVEHLVVDGGRASRLSSIAARRCRDGQNMYGFNASVLYCEHCALRDVVSRNALCGSGLVWSGSNAAIHGNAFAANGDAATMSMWADGLTIVSAPYSTIHDNRFVDNSDVALIVGYGVWSSIERNIIVQRSQPAFAGLMLHNFNSDDLTTSGDFRGAVITGNTVDCGALLCTFGIQVGPRPWDRTKIVVGGELHGNTVIGAKVGISVDGAGLARAPVTIYANAVEAAPPRSYFSSCPQQIPADWMNVSPTSVVDRREDVTPAGSHLSDSCQLTSALSPE